MAASPRTSNERPEQMDRARHDADPLTALAAEVLSREADGADHRAAALTLLPDAPGRTEHAGSIGQLARRVMRRDSRQRWMLAIADVVSAATAFVVTALVLGDDRINLVALVVIPSVVLVSKLLGLYDRDAHLLKKTTLDEAPTTFHVATLYTLVIWLAESFFIETTFGRDQLLALWLLLFAAMLVARATARRFALAVAPEERCLLLGEESAAAWVQGKLDTSMGVKARVVARVSLKNPGHRSETLPGGAQPDHKPGEHLRDQLDSLAVLLAELNLDRVIIAPASRDADEILDVIRFVKSLGVHVSLVPRLFEVVGSSVEFDELCGVTLLGLRRHGLSRSSRALKRCMDLVGASLLLVLLAPVMAVVSLAVKLTSPGPVFFRQRRMGRDDNEFSMLKFRTMVADAEALKAELMDRNEADGLFKIADDPRITKVGRFLRRVSLDELPQLLNVLRGEMSLVGPRPLVIDEDRHVTGWQRRRQTLTPGMTGLWQIFGSARIPLSEMVKIDYLYGANWSLWLDVKILLRTLPYVLARRGL